MSPLCPLLPPPHPHPAAMHRITGWRAFNPGATPLEDVRGATCPPRPAICALPLPIGPRAAHWQQRVPSPMMVQVLRTEVVSVV